MARRRRDYYATLGVSRDATETEIKRAFRELARKHHPDVSPDNNGEVFREINEAYAVLSDRDSRARYDRWGHQDDAGGLSAVVEAAQDVINDLFRRRRGKTRGRDLRYTLELSFVEAAFGCSKTIEIPAGDAKTREFTVVVAAGVPTNTIKTFKGEGLLYSSEKAMEEFGALLPDADREFLVVELAECRAAIDGSDDLMLVQDAVARLEVSAQRIGEAIYAAAEPAPDSGGSR